MNRHTVFADPEQLALLGQNSKQIATVEDTQTTYEIICFLVDDLRFVVVVEAIDSTGGNVGEDERSIVPAGTFRQGKPLNNDFWFGQSDHFAFSSVGCS
nr:hypothetical protein [Sphingobium herbicidovorans]